MGQDDKEEEEQQPDPLTAAGAYLAERGNKKYPDTGFPAKRDTQRPAPLLLTNAILEVMDGSRPSSLLQCFGLNTVTMKEKWQEMWQPHVDPRVNALTVAQVLDHYTSDGEKHVFRGLAGDGEGHPIEDFSHRLWPGVYVNDTIMKHGVDLLNKFNGPSNDRVWFMPWYDIAMRTHRKGGANVVVYKVRGEMLTLPQIAEKFEAIAVPINSHSNHWILAVYHCKKNALLTYDSMEYHQQDTEASFALLKEDSHLGCEHYTRFVSGLEKRLDVVGNIYKERCWQVKL